MNLVFSNPSALWALLAIPAILLIHFLQESSKRVRVSTLFLLERVAPQSIEGARFERLRNSVPLWLQIIAAIIIAWLLSGPRWLREDSRQTVVVILDSSVSMSAFKEKTRDMLYRELQPWTRSAAHTQWHLLESDVRKPSLYAGSSLHDLISTFDVWNPSSGTHALDDALMLGRELVKGAGQVIVVSDHSIKIASDIALLSAGEAFDNVGFSGSSATLTDGQPKDKRGMLWRVMIKNYGNQSQTREWWMEQRNSNTELVPTTGKPNAITLSPGETLVLTGELPPDIEQAEFFLSDDQFSWDDRLPIQRPLARQVQVAYDIDGKNADLMHEMVDALPDTTPSLSSNPSLMITELGVGVSIDSIQVGPNSEDSGRLDAAFTIAEDHELTRGLNWMGLLTSRPKELPLLEGDEPLLWKGNRLLALIRHEKNAEGKPIRRLILNWDLPSSNASRHPAVLVLLHRFIISVRDNLNEPWAGNFECNQLLPIEGSGLKIKAAHEELPYLGRMPEEVGFFTITRNDQPLLRGSVQFADTREANFQKAEPANTLGDRQTETALRQSEADPWTPFWIFALLTCLLGSWGWKSNRTPAAANAPVKSPLSVQRS